jgi:hypothetical protein
MRQPRFKWWDLKEIPRQIAMKELQEWWNRRDISDEKLAVAWFNVSGQFLGND